MESATKLYEELGIAHLQYVGVGLPVQSLDTPTLETPGGMLGASARGERQPFDALCLQLMRQGYALVDLGGGSPDFYRAACREGQRLWPSMKAGELTDKNGKKTAGEDPSGKRRGDRYIVVSEALTTPGGCPALAALDAALMLVGAEINKSLRNVFKLRAGAHAHAHAHARVPMPMCQCPSVNAQVSAPMRMHPRAYSVAFPCPRSECSVS